MERPDFLSAIKIPIGQIPGGSGNALASSIAYMCNEPFRNMSLENAAMHMSILAVKHDVMPMDLTLVEVYETNERLQNPITSKRMYGFLCIEWAIIADVDYESEKYRYLGGLRFTIGAVKRILDLRMYRGRISFLLADNCKDYIPKDPNIKVMHNRHSHSLGQNNTTSGTYQARGSSPPSFVIHDGKPIIAPKYLMPFDKPVPDDWLTIEENFILLLVAQMPLIATDFMCWPDCELNNGELLLIYIKEGCSKVNLLKILTSTENGEYLQNPYVEYVRIKAFRLEPLDTNGNIMVDGEKVPYGPIQGEVLPSIANCVSKHCPRST
jgi:sphingosine kinase